MDSAPMEVLRSFIRGLTYILVYTKVKS
jgi:hypothetical protein